MSDGFTEYIEEPAGVPGKYEVSFDFDLSSRTWAGDMRYLNPDNKYLKRRCNVLKSNGKRCRNKVFYGMKCKYH